jgi:ABC-2 type transport system permease protein
MTTHQAFRALAARDLLLQRSYRLSLAFDVFWGLINVVLYFFISKVVGPNPGVDLAPADTYFEFALAGILMTLVVSSATSEIASRVREEELTGTLEALCAQPLRSGDLVVGWSAFPLCYAVARVVLYLALAVAALDLAASDVDWPGVALILLTAAAAFLPLGMLAAAATVVFKRGETIVGVAIFGMTFAGGAYFPLSVLPDWLEAIGKAMPTRFAYDGLRGALYGGSWATDAAVLAAMGAVGIPIALLAFSRALARAKADGSLAQY